MRRNVSASELSSSELVMKGMRQSGAIHSKTTATKAEAWVAQAAQRLLLDPEAGRIEFEEIVLRQAATLSGDTLRRALGVTSRKLQEMARSKSVSQRAAATAACRAVTCVIATGAVVVDEQSIVKDFLLNTQRALGYALKLADSHEEVACVASAIGKVLAAAALGTAASEIGVSLAYLSSEWLCSEHVYHKHAGAALTAQLASVGLLQALPQQLPTLLHAMTKAFSSEAETAEAIADAAEAVFESLPLADPESLQLADSFLADCIASLTNQETATAAMCCMAAVARPLKQRFQNHIHTSLSAALRCAAAHTSASTAALRLISSYIKEGFITQQQSSSVFVCLLEAARYVPPLLDPLSTERDKVQGRRWRAMSLTSNGSGVSGPEGTVSFSSVPNGSVRFPRYPPGQAEAIAAAFEAIADAFEAGLAQDFPRADEVFPQLWATAIQVMRSRTPGATEAARCIASLCLVHSPASTFVVSPEVTDLICSLQVSPTIVAAVEDLSEGQPHCRAELVDAFFSRAREELLRGKPLERRASTDFRHDGDMMQEWTLITCLEGLLAAKRLFGTVESGCYALPVDQFELVGSYVAPLLRHECPSVKRCAAELICFIAAKHDRPMWADLLVQVLAVAVGDPSSTTRTIVWKAVEDCSEGMIRCLGSPKCAHYVSLSLHDSNEFVRLASLRMAVRISRISHVIPPRLRSVLLTQWNQLQHSRDPLEQARAAHAFGTTHTALLRSAPALMPTMLQQSDSLNYLAGSLGTSESMVQAALFDLVAQLLLGSELPVSAETLEQLQETAVVAIVGGRSAATKPAATALAAIVKRTREKGIDMLASHEGLLPRLLDCLRGGVTQENQDVRIAVMKLLGALGALAPHTATPLLHDEAQKSDDLPWGRGLLHSRYHSFRVVRSLLNILQRPRQRVHHVGCLRAIQTPLKLLGTVKVIQLSKELLPIFCQVADRGAEGVAAEHSGSQIELRAAIKAICFTLSMTPNNIDAAWLGDLVRVAHHGIQAGEAAALQMLGLAAQGLGPAFSPAVEGLIGTLTDLVSCSSCETTSAAAVRCLISIGPALLRPYTCLVAQHLCHCMTRLVSPPPLRYICVEAATKLVIGNVGGTESATPLLHALLYCVASADQCEPEKPPEGSTSPAYNYASAVPSIGSTLSLPPMNSVSGQDVWVMAARGIGDLARICSTYGSAGLGSELFDSAKRDIESSALSKGISLKVVRQALEGEDDMEKRITATAPSPQKLAQEATEEPYTLNHHAIRRALQGFSSPSLWLDNLAQTLLGESPRAALCAASPVARSYPQLSYELFGPAFVSLCAEPLRLESRLQHDHDATKQDVLRMRSLLEDAKLTKALLLESVQGALGSAQISGEVAQRLLSLAEFYERFEEGAAAGTKDGAPKRRVNRYPHLLSPYKLCKLAERCGLYAKALHWAEAAVLARTGDDIEACISLVKAYKNLGIEGADEGILAVLEERGKIAGQETRLQEDLGKTDFAIKKYREEGDMAGIVRCYERLGDWRNILEIAKGEPEEDPALAPYVARASWILGNWEELAASAETIMSTPTLLRAGQAGLGEFYLAVVHTNSGNFKKARDAIFNCRLCVDSELSACLAEGYTRSYDMLVSLQQLVELEEIIEFKEQVADDPSRGPDGLTQLKSVWRSRLEANLMDPTSLRGTLTQHSLLISPQEDTEPWLWFIDACTKGTVKRQAWDTLKMLAGSEDLSLQGLVQKEQRPEVALAVLRYEFEQAVRAPLDIMKDTLCLADSCEATNKVLSAECRMTAVRWGHIMQCTSHDELVAALRPSVDTAMSLEYKPALREGVRSLIWQTWGSLNYEFASESKSPEHAIEAVRGFIQCTHVSAEEVAVPMALRILRLVFLYSTSEKVGQYARENLHTVSASLWLRVVPQLVARLGGDRSDVAEDLLCFAAETFPHAVVYSLLPRISASGVVGMQSRPDESADRVLDVIRQTSPERAALVEQAQLLARALSQTAILESEKWHRALEDANLQAHDRPLDVLQPLMDRLREPPSTVDATHFIETCSKALLGAESLWQRARDTGDRDLLKRGWTLCRQLYYTELEDMKAKVFRHGISLERVAPKLSATKNLALCVPGCAAELNPPLIHSFAQCLPVLHSKTCPKRLSLTDTHGKEHDYLLKGHEDLRLDERVMQLLGLVNGMLRKGGDGQRCESDIVRFSVVPLGSNVGLLGWVADADDLGRLIRSARHAANKRHEAKLVMQECGLEDISGWEAQPQERRVRALEVVTNLTDGDDIHRDLWLGATSSETWVRRRSAFTRSLSVMSIVGYVLGLGDRHLGNIMLQKTTGRIAHIDFGDCFDVTRERKSFAEKVPFRLTRQLRHATGVGGVKGLFRHVAEETMSELRKGRELVMAMLEAFVFDPLIQWRLNASGAKEEVSAAAVSVDTPSPKKRQPVQPTTPEEEPPRSTVETPPEGANPIPAPQTPQFDGPMSASVPIRPKKIAFAKQTVGSHDSHDEYSLRKGMKAKNPEQKEKEKKEEEGFEKFWKTCSKCGKGFASQEERRGHEKSCALQHDPGVVDTMLEASLRKSRASVRFDTLHPPGLSADEDRSPDTPLEPLTAGMAASNTQARLVVERLLRKLTGEDQIRIPEEKKEKEKDGEETEGDVEGVEPEPEVEVEVEGGKAEPLSIPQQIERLVSEATSLPNLADSYRGWEPWS